MSLQRAPLAALAMILAGCAPKEVARPDHLPEPAKLPPVTSKVERVREDGVERVRVTSYLDDFSIVLPVDFRGSVLAEADIEAFCSNIAKRSPDLAAQIRRQADVLRPAGGALFAMNLRPSSVADGFAENMNVGIRGSTAPTDLDSAQSSTIAELERAMPGAKASASRIAAAAVPMVELVVRSKPPTGSTNSVTRYIYLAVRDRQVFTISYAAATSREPKVRSEFRRSAQSLRFLSGN